MQAKIDQPTLIFIQPENNKMQAKIDKPTLIFIQPESRANT